MVCASAYRAKIDKKRTFIKYLLLVSSCCNVTGADPSAFHEVRQITAAYVPHIVYVDMYES